MDEADARIQRRSKIVQHPSANTSPVSTCAEALGIAQSGMMGDCCVMWTDDAGNFHIGWSKMGNADLAAYGAVLTHMAARRLIEYEPPATEAKHGA